MSRAERDDERAVLFDCNGERLLGILSPANGSIGVLIIVGGPQYRAGSHRYFVKLARKLAAAGYPCLRFDCRGMGDSTGPQRSFTAVDQDIAAAIAQLTAQCPSVERVVLWGLCDAASAALIYMNDSDDRRIGGLCLLNPWVRSEVSHAQTYVKHYYARRILDPKVWAKALVGGLGSGAVREALHTIWCAFTAKFVRPSSAHSYQQRMAEGWLKLRVPVLLVLSEDDFTAREFESVVGSSALWMRAMATQPPVRVALPHADHTLSGTEAQQASEDALLRFLFGVRGGTVAASLG